MKRLALIAAIAAMVVVAACSSQAKPAADTGSAMKGAAPAMSDSSAMKADTGMAMTMKMDSTKKDTSKKP